MHIKAADDKTAHLQQLQALLELSGLDAQQHKRLKDQYWRMKQGVQGERDAAHYIDSHFADSSNHAVLHDLRLELDGQVAQIDHLIVSRGMLFYMLETKHFNGNLCINEFGEFSVQYGQITQGIESPLEQSRRHERVLRKALELLGVSGRLGKDLTFHHVVLVNPKGQIQRPDPSAFDTRDVIKADQFASWREKHIEKGMGVLRTLATAVNLRSEAQLRDMAERLAKLHRPAVFQMPFPLPGIDSKAVSIDVKARQLAQWQPEGTGIQSWPRSESNERLRTRPNSSNGAAALAPARQPNPAEAAKGVCAAPSEQSPKKRLVCEHCGTKITYAEGVYCWDRAERFGGVQYCRAHQQLFR